MQIAPIFKYTIALTIQKRTPQNNNNSKEENELINLTVFMCL